MDALIKALVDGIGALGPAGVIIILLLIAVGFLWNALRGCESEPREALERSTVQIALVKDALDAQASSREALLLALAANTQAVEALKAAVERLERMGERRGP